MANRLIKTAQPAIESYTQIADAGDAGGFRVRKVTTCSVVPYNQLTSSSSSGGGSSSGGSGGGLGQGAPENLADILAGKDGWRVGYSNPALGVLVYYKNDL